MSLPIIDLSPFLSATFTATSKRAAAAALNTACRTHGFFYLSHHLIPASLNSQVLSEARNFFLTTPASEKVLLSRLPGDAARGYQRLGENVTQGRSDHHEALDFYRPVPHPDPSRLLHGENRWPADNPAFRAAFEEYWARLRALGAAVMRAMAWALGYEDDEEVLLRSTRDGFWVARVIGYPPLTGSSEGGVSCGVHTDYGCTTFLLADETPGALQVLMGEEWVDADPVEGCYVVNIGDMMEIWTNGLWTSTKHRVVHKAGRYRVSVPFFYEPNWDAVVKPLEKCVAQTGGVPKYQQKVYGQHLAEKVSGNFYTGEEKEEKEEKLEPSVE